MTNKWKIKTLTHEQNKIKDILQKELGIHPLLCKLLVDRGIHSYSEAKHFFRPQFDHLYDPFLMNDMNKAVQRLNEALTNNEKILIYGDYDVDGTTAVALVYKFLVEFSSKIDYYIPDRYNEGYGISYQGIDFAAENDFKLIICLDCGIKAVDKIKYAKEKGVDFIICDHHKPDDILPDAVAVLNPKRIDSTYPDDHLSGCGVGFKFMQAFAINNEIPFSKLEPLLDLIAVSVASDIVPIIGENRVLTYYGLKQLNSNPSVGLKSIIEVCNLQNTTLTVNDIVFKIGPRINASGRIQSGREAVELLVTKDLTVAREKSNNINQYNDTRRELDKNITIEANAVLEKKDFINSSRKSIVIYDELWHKGVVGIVASRLSEEYYRPTIILTKSGELITGSARSVPGFDIYKAIDSCRDLLENFGGHMYAAGLSMKEEILPEFKKRFEKYVTENIEAEQLIPQIEIDAVIDFKDITPQFFKILKQFNPFGPENMKPVFCTKKVYDYGSSRLVGKDLSHLKLEVIDNKSQNIMNGIAFGMHEHNEYIKSSKPFDICYTIEENTFNGKTSIQLMIKDIRPSEEE
ncbi:MAG: single-stranded-DNA-specific exonuclease RecJ [Candidatus Azobacteroides sp.]|nr:single-stranded-DNA-specific exonuclease RecJ [Candidatus Azobacteroides sp.]